MFHSKKLLIQPYKPGTWIGEWTSSGTYSCSLAGNGIYEIVAVSGGAGGLTYDTGAAIWQNLRGGTGAFYQGRFRMTKGTYTVTIGGGGNGGNWNAQIGGVAAGGGGSTSFGSYIALSGAGGYVNEAASIAAITQVNSEIWRMNYTAGYGNNGESLTPQVPAYTDDQLGPSNNYGLGSYGKGGGTFFDGASAGGRSGSGGYLRIVYIGL